MKPVRHIDEYALRQIVRRTFSLGNAALAATTALAVPLVPLTALVASSERIHPSPLPVILRPAIVGVGVAGLLLVIGRYIWSSWSQASAGVTLFLIAFVLYPTWMNELGTSLGAIVPFAYLAVTSCGAWLVGRCIRAPWTLVLTFTIGIPVGWSLITLEAERHWASNTAAAEVERIVEGAPTIPRSDDRPDIYYLVLDGFARADVLRRLYGIDSSEHLRKLKAAGVVIPRLSRSNYSQTELSLASSLNGQYLDDLAEVMPNSHDRRPLRRLIQESGLIRQLKLAGYRFTMIGSDASMTAWHNQADECICGFPSGPTELEFALLVHTPLAALDLNRYALSGHRIAVLGQFSSLQSMREGTDEHPAFVFAHIFSPHPPFVFARDGSSRFQERYSQFDGSRYVGTAGDYVSGYRHQARFVLDRITELILHLRARRRPPVIIMVGDHGSGLRMQNYDALRTDAWERLSIFSAYFSPKPATSVPDEMTPVNALRWAIATATGIKLPMVANRSYISAYSQPYRFHEVQERDGRDGP